MRDTRVSQIGWHGECARTGCGKASQYRVILGSWDVQAYVCTSHVVWAVNLDMITQTSGEAMGWQWGHAQPGSTIRASIPAQVIPMLGPITRTDFGRDAASQVASAWPVPREVNGVTIPTFSPAEITEDDRPEIYIDRSHGDPLLMN